MAWPSSDLWTSGRVRHVWSLCLLLSSVHSGPREPYRLPTRKYGWTWALKLWLESTLKKFRKTIEKDYRLHFGSRVRQTSLVPSYIQHITSKCTVVSNCCYTLQHNTKAAISSAKIDSNFNDAIAEIKKDIFALSSMSCVRASVLIMNATLMHLLNYRIWMYLWVIIRPFFLSVINL